MPSALHRYLPDSLTTTGLFVAALAAGAAAAGLFWTPPGDAPATAISAWGERVVLYGEGLYRRDTVFRGAGAAGTDIVTLAVVVPMLAGALWLRARGSRRAGLVAAGGLAWTAYVYASLALGSVVYNELFLVHVAAASASIFALGLAVVEGRVTFERFEINPPSKRARLPRRALAAFLLVSGIATAIIWLPPLVGSLAAGVPPERAAHYTGRVTDALDLGVITPATIAAGMLVWKRQALGYAVAVPLLVLEVLLLPMIATQTALQLRAGVVLAPPEIIGPVSGFVVLAGGATWALAAVLRRVPAHAVAVVALLLSAPALTQKVLAQEQTMARPDARAVETFTEETFAALADSFAVPGAVLALVRGDSVLALEGYGFADLAAARPADSERTLLRVGSVSKLVTATAVLQLWERGRLDLHADVNRYLKRVEVPEAFGVPVTAHDVLTHTAGFDERIFAAGAPDTAPDLASYLAATLPPRIYPPGTLHLYSNHGYGLLGVLVEDVSGQAFDDYLDARLFAPLGMSRSTFRQPPPEPLHNDLATGYVASGDGYTPLPFDYIAFAPAGSFTTTAADMARFMRFHLTAHTPDGAAEDILADSTRTLMHGPRWRAHPAMDGMGYGFFRLGLGRYPALRHRGGWPGWIAQVVLVPSVDLGLFVAINTDDNGFVDALLERFAADVLGGPLPLPERTVPGLSERAEGLVGTYRLARHDHGTFGKLAALFGMPMPDLRVEVRGDTALVLANQERWLYEVEPWVFVEPGLDPQRFFFETNGARRALRLHAESASLERIAWWEAAALHRLLLAGCFALFLSAVGAWVGGQIYRRNRAEPPPLLLRARGLAAGASALYLAFGVGLAVALLGLGPQGLFQPFPGWMRALLMLPVLASVLGVLTAPMAVLLWRRRLGSRASRVHYTAVALAAVFASPLLAYWNVLGFRF